MNNLYASPVLRHPFTAMIAGPTSSGKTVLTRSILENYKHVTSIKSSPLKVIYCYSIWQDMFEQGIPGTDIVYNEGLVSEEDIKSIKPDIVVVDDLMTELADSPALSSLFTKKSHHLNFSVIFIVQNVFHQGKYMRDTSLNCHYIFLMKTARDKAQIVKFASQFAPKRTRSFIKIFEDATKLPFSHLLIDSSPTCPDELRLRSNIVPLVRGAQPEPVIYKLE